MKLTRKLQKRIEYALRNAERAEAYIMGKGVAVCRRDAYASTTLHYTRPDGGILYEVERTYGSDLTGLHSAIAELRSILAPQYENA